MQQGHNKDALKTKLKTVKISELFRILKEHKSNQSETTTVNSSPVQPKSLNPNISFNVEMPDHESNIMCIGKEITGSGFIEVFNRFKSPPEGKKYKLVYEGKDLEAELKDVKLDTIDRRLPIVASLLDVSNPAESDLSNPAESEDLSNPPNLEIQTQPAPVSETQEKRQRVTSYTPRNRVLKTAAQTSISIMAKSLTPITFNIECNPNDTFLDLANALARDNGIEVDRVKIMYANHDHDWCDFVKNHPKMTVAEAELNQASVLSVLL